ncbi:MAG: hypothetical protein FJX53_08440, partial [Alphaproteobacteria bacterium]|nr:hypothetical protein [Alphaproteobacteria bacterium]
MEARNAAPEAMDGRNAIRRTGAGPDVPFEMHAFQSFVVGLKLYWTKALYEDVTAKAKALALADPKAIEREMRGDIVYQYYGWLEHYLQQY